MGTGEFNTQGNPAMDINPTQGKVEIVASCYRTPDKPRPDGLLGSWCLYGQQGFCCFGISTMCKKVFYEKKNGFRHFNAPKTSFKVPASATPNEVDRESVQNKTLGF